MNSRLAYFFIGLTLLAFTFSAHSQTAEFWGLLSADGLTHGGVIYKTDGNGENYSTEETFFRLDASQPLYGKVCEASNGKFYGLTENGGTDGDGVLFEYDPLTEEYVTKHEFNGFTDGESPTGSLIEASDGKLYGMTSAGGTWGQGIIFHYDPATDVFTKTVDMNANITGSVPYGSLIEASNGRMYGMTSAGGTNGDGVIFEYHPLSTALFIRHSFHYTTGKVPYGSLIEATDGKLYGMTTAGGTYGYGAIFDFDPATNTYTHRFGFYQWGDGGRPYGDLVQAPNGLMYGMTYNGGASSNTGALFDFDPVTAAYNVLMDLDNSTGRAPWGSLMLGSNGNLFGMTSSGGTHNSGVLFEYNYSTYSYYKRFEFRNDGGLTHMGRLPKSTLMQASNGKLYGMVRSSGGDGEGTLIEYDPVTMITTKKLDFHGHPKGRLPYGALLHANDDKFYFMMNYGGLFNLGGISSYNRSTGEHVAEFIFNDSIATGRNPTGSLIQASNGKLYGMTMWGGTNDMGTLFEFDPVTKVFTKKVDFDGTAKGRLPQGSLFEASNGKLYGMTYAGGTIDDGVIFEFDPATDTYTKKFDFDTWYGSSPYGSLMEASNGKLYGMASQGGTANSGVLFEYDFALDFYTKKIDFGSSNGIRPRGNLIQATNGLLYGLTSQGGTSNYGTLFDYDIATNTLTTKANVSTSGRYPRGTLMQASNGKLYGTTNVSSLFEYDIALDVFTHKINFTGNGDMGETPQYGNLIEIICNETTETLTITACDTYTVPSGDETYTTIGTYQVMDTIPNTCGGDHVLTINLTVTVGDVTPPETPTLGDLTGECTVTAVAPTTNDYCAGVITGTTTDPLTYNSQGTFVINWTFDDGSGNSIVVPQNVIVDDVTNPATPTLANVTGECSATATAPATTDNCSGTITGTTTDPLTYSAQGSYVITWTFDDGNGNTSTQTQNVVIDDVTAPVADNASLSDVTAECSVTSLTAPTATDNCAGSITGTHNATLPITTQGTTVVTWTYNDGNGNTSTQTQNVVIDDVTAPVADNATLSDVTAECSVTSLTAPTATDNCAGSITGTHNATLPITAQGTTVVTWTYNDGNGNASTQTQNVVIDDVTTPIADNASLADVTAECSVTSLTASTATDNCAGSIAGTHNATLPIITQGTTVVTWTYDDGNGNTSTQTQNVVIDDVTAPVADNATLSNVTTECSVTSLTAPTATDNCAGSITGTHNATLPITTQGTTVVTWTYDDGNGNTSTQTQNVVIDDVSAPVADNASLGDVAAECSVTSLTAPTATDNCAGSITGTHNATLPITAQGTTVVTWTYNDGNGNTSTQTQNVVIDDVSAPVADNASLANVTAECSVTSLTAPTATDNCAGSITGTHNATLPITAQGTTVVTWTYNDGNGNTSTQTQNVVIDDVSAPVADNASLANVTAECSVTSLTAPTATDNCAGSITGTHNATLPITSSATITWTYDDGNGNMSTQTQNVVIDDITAPVVDNASLGDVAAECSVTSLTAPTATDNCVGSITGTHNATLPITNQGTTVVTWTYDDGNGNTSTQMQNVVIDDVTDPATPTLSDVTGECSATAVAPTTTDNCAGVITGTTTDPLTYSTQGTYVINWVFDDGNGNSITVPQNVVIDDVTDPATPTLSNVTGECSATAVAPTTTDNCAGVITGTTTDPLTYSTQGTYVINWVFDDGNGNSITVPQNVVIDDVTDPATPTLSAVTGECSATAIAPTTTDNCAGTITGTTTDPLTYTGEGTYTINWVFDDGNGNSITVPQNVVIDDVTDPATPTLSAVTGECSATAVTPTTTDNCAGVITGTTTDPLTYSTQGTYVINWVFDDGNGNSITVPQNVVIDDVTDPATPTLSAVTGECSATAIAPTTTDNCAGIITGTTTDPLTYTGEGTYTINWIFDDGNGNSITVPQNVVIDDITDPVAPTLTDVTGECSASATTPTTTDNCAGTITGTTSDPVTYNTQGSYVINWIFDDGNGNSITVPQNVIVDDVTAPIADSPTLTDVTAECDVTTLTPPTATDNCGGVVVVSNDVTLPITAQGTTVVTWTYTDSEGNNSQQTQNIVINDITDPVVPTLADIAGECDVTPTAPTTTDNCAGTITGTTPTVFPITTQGTTVVTWTFDDGNGNSVTANQNVIIDDVTAPVADNASLVDVIAECEVTSLVAPTATDNCAGLVNGTHNATLPLTGQGTTTVTWTYDDGNGNTSTQTQDVVITDVTAPVADNASLVDVTGECEVTSLTAPTATDNCSGVITGTHNASLPITAQGTTTVIWTYDDGNGNTSTQTQDVVVTDATAPVADLANLADLTDECEVTPTAPTATDNCSGSITGTPDVAFPITAGGTTTITWTYDDGNGNTSTQTQDVTITPIDVNTTTTSNATDYTIEADASGYSYQWIENCGTTNDVISGATDQTYTPSTNGTYAVIIDNGTCSDTSDCVIIDDLGIDKNDFGTSFKVYPNPTSGNLRISLGELYTGVSIKVFNTIGQIIVDRTFGTTDEVQIELEGTPGMYILEIKTEEEKSAHVSVIKK